MDWYKLETPVQVVNLNATKDGMKMYRSFGFSEPRFPSLRIQLS